ncbi:MAG: 50S ribosomal protein L25 [Armatimonadetes bacterium]|nr:50S ribosomal protein L25 [Armatimonadota bacterium]
MLRTRLTSRPRTVGRRALLTRIRREGYIPGVVYGHGDPLSIQIPIREVEHLLTHQGSGGLVDLDLEGTIQTALLKEVGRHPATGAIVNLGFQRVALSEIISARVPLTVVGVGHVEENGGVAQIQLDHLDVHCRAGDLPTTLPVDVSQSEIGDAIRIADLALPPGVELAQGVDPGQVVVSITSPAVPRMVEEELEASEAAGTEPPRASD